MGILRRLPDAAVGGLPRAHSRTPRAGTRTARATSLQVLEGFQYSPDRLDHGPLGAQPELHLVRLGEHLPADRLGVVGLAGLRVQLVSPDGSGRLDREREVGELT